VDFVSGFERLYLGNPGATGMALVAKDVSHPELFDGILITFKIYILQSNGQFT
jgi:hypothetical protein